MTVDDVVNRVGILIRDRKRGDEITTRLNSKLQEIAEMGEFECFNVRLNPAVKTRTGVRNYELSDDFPGNFIRGSGEEGERRMVKLSNGTNEWHLEFESEAKFFARDVTAETNARPTAYTIRANAAGGRELWLAPPPDANSDSHYTISGIYRPVSFRFMDGSDQLPPLPAWNLLIYGLASELRPDRADFAQMAEQGRRELLVRAAQGQDHRWTPQLAEFGGRNEYDQTRDY